MEKRYFDLDGFFKNEMKRLSGRPAQKTASVNGKLETHSLDSIHLHRELSLFSNSGINRPAWSDKYKVDSVFNEQKNLTGLRYAALDEALKTQSISIELEGKDVRKISIENTTESAIATTRQLLVYQPEKGYSIRNAQEVVGADSAIYLVKVIFSGQ